MTKESRLDYRYSPDEIGELNAVLDGQRAEIEWLKAERTYIAETLFGELYADNARLLAALRRIADDGKNCADHCRRQARAALEPKPQPPLCPVCACVRDHRRALYPCTHPGCPEARAALELKL
jgi:hypothetical protein